MSNERIDLDSIESEWDKYQSDGPVDDYLASLNISRLIAELKRCYEEIDRVRSIAEDLHAYIVSDADISLSIAEKQMDWVEASE